MLNAYMRVWIRTLDTGLACTGYIFQSILQFFSLSLRPNELKEQLWIFLCQFSCLSWNWVTIELFFLIEHSKKLPQWIYYELIAQFLLLGHMSSSLQHQLSQHQLQRDLPQLQKGCDLKTMISARVIHPDPFLFLQQKFFTYVLLGNW